MMEGLELKGIPKSGSNNTVQPTPTAINRVVLFKDGKMVKASNTYTGWYTTEQLQNNPNLLFLFGDNDKAKYRIDNINPGGGGQALVTRPTGKGQQPYDRLPSNGGVNGNAIGITTTFYDEYTPKIDEFKELMNKEFKPIEDWVKNGGCVVIPCDNNGNHSLGTGIAGLAKNIPGAIQYIQSKVKELVILGQQQVLNHQDLNTLKQELHDTLLTECQLYHSLGKLRGYLGSSAGHGMNKDQPTNSGKQAPEASTEAIQSIINNFDTKDSKKIEEIRKWFTYDEAKGYYDFSGIIASIFDLYLESNSNENTGSPIIKFDRQDDS